MLLKIQRNELFNTLTSSGINPSDFSELTDHDSDNYQLSYRYGQYYFSIQLYNNQDSFIINSFPYTGLEKALFKWHEVVVHFGIWCSVLRIELNEPDLWQDLALNAKIFNKENASDEKFSDNELVELQSQLRLVKHNIEQADIPDSAIKAISSTIKDAPEKAERFTKKEWQNWFIGAIISQITSLAMSQENVTKVYEIIKSSFIGLLSK